MKIAELLLNNYKSGKVDHRFRLEEYMNYCYNLYVEYQYSLKLIPLTYVKWLQIEN